MATFSSAPWMMLAVTGSTRCAAAFVSSMGWGALMATDRLLEPGEGFNGDVKLTPNSLPCTQGGHAAHRRGRRGDVYGRRVHGHGGQPHADAQGLEHPGRPLPRLHARRAGDLQGRGHGPRR